MKHKKKIVIAVLICLLLVGVVYAFVYYRNIPSTVVVEAYGIDLLDETTGDSIPSMDFGEIYPLGSVKTQPLSGYYNLTNLNFNGDINASWYVMHTNGTLWDSTQDPNQYRLDVGENAVLGVWIVVNGAGQWAHATEKTLLAGGSIQIQVKMGFINQGDLSPNHTPTTVDFVVRFEGAPI